MSYLDTYQDWLQQPALTSLEREELSTLTTAELESRFFGSLEFGTAGLRGIMGLGLNRMNIYVIRHATQAFAEVILSANAPADGIAICYDCRNHSEEFAKEAASVMAGNGIPVRLFSAMRPTPELSFAIRAYGCVAGINITASHNPKEYNGYKVYWSDGAQLPPHHAAAIAEKMDNLDVFASIKSIPFEDALANGTITLMGQETDDAFLNQVLAQISDSYAVAKIANNFRMVYTPFHGTGYEQVPYVLKKLGIKNLFCVPEQMITDGDFPTVASPNPENFESFALAIALAKKENADFILGTDPDTDRVGILARDRTGEYKQISGNQTGVLLMDYLIGAKKRTGSLPPKPVVLKTIVTTEMARQVAEKNGVTCYDTFTGFKFMAEKKNELEASGEGNVIFSYEESYGYMIGDYVRDKDAVTASLLLTEMTAWYAAKGQTLFDALDALFEKYGFYAEKTLNLVMPHLQGMAKMQALMLSLRANPLNIIAGVPVQIRKDYESGQQTDVSSGTVTSMPLVGSNVLKYHLADGTTLVVRPSGTEPKVKVYILTTGANTKECQQKIARFSAWADTLSQ
ncbi:MAG: phospho-sugar mutase [Evtepia sp.]